MNSRILENIKLDIEAKLNLTLKDCIQGRLDSVLLLYISSVDYEYNKLLEKKSSNKLIKDFSKL